MGVPVIVLSLVLGPIYLIRLRKDRLAGVMQFFRSAYPHRFHSRMMVLRVARHLRGLFNSV
jgi:hypothetical protein